MGMVFRAGRCQDSFVSNANPAAGPVLASASPGVFATTHWSVVLMAGQADSPQATEALEKLCRAYWYPLYVYVRRQGNSPEDAQDLTQIFFSRTALSDQRRELKTGK